MRILIACEFSGTVRRAFRARGHDAWSCDVLPATDSQEYHITGDVCEVLNKYKYDMVIAHPPCTWLCQAMRTNAARKDRPRISEVYEEERDKALKFALSFFSYADKVAVENPIGYLNQVFRKPDQIVRPWMFGHPYKKDVCLWLKGLPLLEPTNIVEGPYKKLDFWSTDRNKGGYSKKSITFEGIAEAMASQWGRL